MNTTNSILCASLYFYLHIVVDKSKALSKNTRQAKKLQWTIEATAKKNALIQQSKKISDTPSFGEIEYGCTLMIEFQLNE